MKVNFVDFGEQYRQHKEEYDKAINNCLENGQLILRGELEKFEEELASRLGMKYAVGVNSGTDALLLALVAKQVQGPVHTSGYTFKATIEAIAHAHSMPVVGDIGDNRLIQDLKLPSIPVHIEGMVATVTNPIIEDAAQAIGASGVGYSGTACYSFYPAKILGGFGDGGAVVTNDRDVFEKVKLLRHHWQTDKNEVHGYNSRLDNVQAAFLSVKLKYLDDILARREEIANKYKELEGVVGLPIYQEGRVWQDYIVRTKEPEKLAGFLKAKDIETLGVGLTPPHQALNIGITLDNVEKLYSEMVRLPCNETLTDSQVDYVIDSVKEYAGV